jgi:hypothetical protein
MAALPWRPLAGRARPGSPTTSHVKADRRIVLAPAWPSTGTECQAEPGTAGTTRRARLDGRSSSALGPRRAFCRPVSRECRGNEKGTKPLRTGLTLARVDPPVRGPRRSETGRDPRWALGNPDSDGEGGIRTPDGRKRPYRFSRPGRTGPASGRSAPVSSVHDQRP